jgi:predicted DNA binding CopG/RHH family protein
VERHPEVKPVPKEPTKRFTIDVPVSLHTRIKAQCATEGLTMADVLREILETRFPAKS